MPHHKETRFVSYTAQQMFDLVLDVERYPEFLPWCQSCELISKEENFLIADLGIGYKGIVQKFRSRVQFTSPTDISVDYLDGPMKYLKNTWHFEDTNLQQCKVDFFIDFSFGQGLLQFAVNAVFEKAVSQMIQAFETRAHKVYSSTL